jgi:hypothetical protein
MFSVVLYFSVSVSVRLLYYKIRIQMFYIHIIWISNIPSTTLWKRLDVYMPNMYGDISIYIYIYIMKSKSHYNWRSVGMSRYRAHSGTCDQILLFVRRLFSEICCLSAGRPLWREVGSVICLSQSSNSPAFTSNIYVTCVLQFSNLYIYIYIYNII